MFVCSGELLTSFQADMAMGKVPTLLRCSRIQGRTFGPPNTRDKEALTGQRMISPTTADIPPTDHTCRPGHSRTKISTSGLPSISPVQPSRSNNRAARPLDPSSTRRDLTILYPLPSAQESTLATGSATATYVTFISFIKSMFKDNSFLCGHSEQVKSALLQNVLNLEMATQELISDPLGKSQADRNWKWLMIHICNRLLCGKCSISSELWVSVADAEWWIKEA